jgi:lysozyme family protein
MDAWTDERLDDLAASLRPLPAQMARNTEAIERITEDIRAMRGDMTAMRADMAALRSDFSSSQRQIAPIGWAMATAVVALLIALVIAAV